MKKIFLVIFSMIVHSYAHELNSKHIVFSVNAHSGTLGSGLQLTKPGLVYDGAEYLNTIGIPFEFFSLKIDSKVYANDNAEGYKGVWPKKGLRENDKNIPTTVRKNGDIITAVTTLPGVFRVTHIYQIGKNRNILNKTQKKSNQEKNIAIDVKVENLSSKNVNMLYTRGIDMDPPDFLTKNSMGYQEQGKVIVPKTNLVYTVSAKHPGDYPLSIFSEDEISHRGAILAFDSLKGCLYDPDKIVQKSLNPYSGDGVIYMIFYLGKVSPNENKSFTLSYYLDDDIEDLIKTIDTENPKITKDSKTLLYTLKHHNTTPKESRKKTFTLKSTNEHFIDKGKQNIFVEVKNSSVLPDGITVVFGKNSDILTQEDKKIDLSSAYSYNEPIPVWVRYDKKWRAKSKKYIELEVGTSRAEGRFKTLRLSLSPRLDDTIVMKGNDSFQFDIPYGEGKKYERIAKKNLRLISKAGKGVARNAKVIVESGTIPKGLHLKVNGVDLGRDFTYRFDKDMAITLDRNAVYAENKTSTVNLALLDSASGKRVVFGVTLEPLARKLDIVVSPENPSVRLDELEESNLTVVTLFANGKQIDGDSFATYKLKADCGDLNCKLTKDEENHRFLLKVSPELIVAFTKTGETEISLKLEKGFFPNDKAEKEFIYTVEDIGWKKWIDPLIDLLLLLLLLWYLWGLTGGKKRFKKSQVVAHAPIQRGKIDRNAERNYVMRSEIPWWDALIPYRAQRTRVDDLRFIARKNRQIYLEKRSQTDVQLDDFEIDDPGDKDKKLFPGNRLETNRALYTIL